MIGHKDISVKDETLTRLREAVKVEHEHYEGMNECHICDEPLMDAVADKIESQQSEVKRLNGILNVIKDNMIGYTENEGTSYPWWAICKKGSFGRILVIEGPFFSRELAENHRKARIYDYKEKSFVYCFSGHQSAGYRTVVDTLRSVAKKDKND